MCDITSSKMAYKVVLQCFASGILGDFAKVRRGHDWLFSLTDLSWQKRGAIPPLSVTNVVGKIII